MQQTIFKLFEWLNRPTINKSGFASVLGFKTQYWSSIKKRNSISDNLREEMILALEIEIKAAQNLISHLKEKH